MAELTVDNLHLAYGDNPILKGVSLTLERGEVVSLLGPSGSGKTTLLRAVAGLEAPHQGTIRIGDKVGVRRRRAASTCRPRGATSASCSSRTRCGRTRPCSTTSPTGSSCARSAAARSGRASTTALEQLSLGHLGERFPHQLSGGQQQRVALARALVYNPPVILLDEPLSNLDAKLREEARAWLRELIVRMQLSALCVTHDQSEALAMSDRILLLNNGAHRAAGHAAGDVRRPGDAVHRRLHGQQQPARPGASTRCATARRCSKATAGSSGARRGEAPRRARTARR